MTKYLSSRPGSEEDPFLLEDLVPAELELISALLYNVKLGSSGMYRQAAFSLMEKIERYVGDSNYIRECSDAVDVAIDILDDQGWTTATIDRNHFEILV